MSKPHPEPSKPAPVSPPPAKGGGPTGVEAAEEVFGGKAKVTKRQYKPLPPLDSKPGQVPSFETYFADHIPEIRRVQLLLETKLSDNPAIHDDQIREAEAHKGRLGSILAWADSYLDLAERRELVQRDSDYTDVDREIHLAAAVSRERRFRDVVKNLYSDLSGRVSLGQSRMKSFSAERL